MFDRVFLNRGVIVLCTAVVAGVIGFGWGYNYGTEKEVSDVQESVEEAVDTDRSESMLVTSSRALEGMELEGNARAIEFDGTEQVDIDAALKVLGSLRGDDRRDYVYDLFTYLAKSESPDESLRIAMGLEKDSEYALRVLTAEWLISEGNLTGRKEDALRRRIMSLSGNQLGLEVELTKVMAEKRVSSAVAGAWMEAHKGHVNRSTIYAQLLASKLHTNPEEVLSRADDWTEWERKSYQDELLTLFSRKGRKNAWNWYLENEDLFEGDHSKSILDQWARVSPNTVGRLALSLPAGEKRDAAIQATMVSKASKGASSAMAWADNLENPDERQLAYEAMYESVPKGVGAMLEVRDGLPYIRSVLPNGPLSETGLKAGDRIVEVEDVDGVTHGLYGRSLEAAGDIIRGDPGTPVSLKVLRTNEKTGEREEYSVTVTRDLLLIGK